MIENIPMTEDQFISDVQTELTSACSLPFTVPRKEIQRIIKYAAKWFYKKYEDAVEERFYVILPEVWDNPEFKKTRTIFMPQCVFAVNYVSKTAGEGSFWSGIKSMPDFSIEKLIFMQDGGRNLMATENLMYYTIWSSWTDLAQAISLYPISYNYNRNSKKLFIGGDTDRTKNALVLNVYVELPLESLYNDEIFFRYVVAKVKMQLSKIIGLFNFNFPGDVTINYDLYREEGRDELEKIEEEIKDEEGLDFFLTSNGW